MDSLSMAFILYLITGVLIGTCQPSNCHAQCDYEPVTARADCTSRNLNCIPINYPDSLVMDLSHNNISVLEPGDFSGTFSRLVELYLDYNTITDVTSLLGSTGLGNLQKLSLEHNAIRTLRSTCNLNSLFNISLDYNSLLGNIMFPSCGALDYFSANFNPLSGFYPSPRLPSFISLQFTEMSSFHLTNNDIGTLLLDNNKIVSFSLTGNNIHVMSLSHNKLSTFILTAPSLLELNIASNVLKDLQSVDVRQSQGTILTKLGISNNSFDSLVQPDWAGGTQILYADDNILANLSATTLHGFINLTELHLANNRLLFISSTALSQLTMLRYLYLDGNALTSLPDGIFLSQVELVELSISNNQLSELHPENFLGLDSLERLYLAGNRLVYVHLKLFRLIPWITKVDLSQSKLLAVDLRNCNLFSNLTDLLLTHNSIHDIGSILGHCNHLVVLDLSFNQIQVVPGDSLTVGNRALSRLELAGNPLQCDCRLASLCDWLRNNPPSVLPRCQGPPQNSGAVVMDLNIHDFICNPPKAMTNVNQLIVMVGQTATVSCTAADMPTPTITWLDPNATVIPDKWQGRFIIARDMSLHIISVEVSDQGMYTCLVQNVLGETDKAIVNVTVTEELKAEPTGVYWAVLPTMFITIIVTIAVVVLVISLRRYQKKDHSTSAVEGVKGVPRLTVGFRKTEPTRSDDGYVNETVEGEYMTPSAGKECAGEEYEVPTTSAGHPPGRYQRHLKVIAPAYTDDADFYEPINIGGKR